MRTFIDLPAPPDPADIPDPGALIPRVNVTATLPDSARPRSALVASAARLIAKDNARAALSRTSTAEPWQEDAWEAYDLVGELRFLANVLAGQAAKARFYVGRYSDTPGEPPVPIDNDDTLTGILNSLGGGPDGLSQIIERLFVNKYIAGDGYLVGIPRDLLPDADPEVEPVRDAEGGIVITDLEWRMLSVTEVAFAEGKKMVLHLGESESERVKGVESDFWPIRMWDGHPRRAWDADSPTRSSLPVLREIIGLTMHIGAQIDSRLAGAGVILAPESASIAAKRALGLPEDGDDDPFTDALIKTMMTPISDRASASAYVPLVWTVPDTAVSLFKHMTFDKQLDANAGKMRDDAIRRFALGADAPPELLLGVGGMNHWGAWIVQSDVVNAHLVPPLKTIARDLSVEFLRPIALANGYTEEQVADVVIWFDVDDLISRPSRGPDALTLHAAGIVSAKAVRDAFGFDDGDAPSAEELALAMVTAQPMLMASPGLPVIVDQLRALLAGRAEPMPAGTTVDDGNPRTPPIESTGEGIPEESPLALERMLSR